MDTKSFAQFVDVNSRRKVLLFFVIIFTSLERTGGGQ